MPCIINRLLIENICQSILFQQSRTMKCKIHCVTYDQMTGNFHTCRFYANSTLSCFCIYQMQLYSFVCISLLQCGDTSSTATHVIGQARQTCWNVGYLERKPFLKCRTQGNWMYFRTTKVVNPDRNSLEK